jgi:hypothetical protein
MASRAAILQQTFFGKVVLWLNKREVDVCLKRALARQRCIILIRAKKLRYNAAQKLFIAMAARVTRRHMRRRPKCLSARRNNLIDLPIGRLRGTGAQKEGQRLLVVFASCDLPFRSPLPARRLDRTPLDEAEQSSYRYNGLGVQRALRALVRNERR